MKKNEKKQQDQDVKVYDFRHCNEEISIGVFVDSDLSKTVANVIYRHCSDIETEDLARELHREGFLTLSSATARGLADYIRKSELVISAKKAVCQLLEG